jgi:hypothetical protein
MFYVAIDCGTLLYCSTVSTDVGPSARCLLGTKGRQVDRLLHFACQVLPFIVDG